MLRPDWTVCVELGRVDPPGAARRAMWDIVQAAPRAFSLAKRLRPPPAERVKRARRRGRPPQLDPSGDRFLPNGGVEDLAGSPTTGCGLLLPVRQDAAAQVIQSGRGML